ncbi:ogr/Delta-like zinc finger family protein [Cupriavidus sp. AcVe19-1a]|uniref:ogr/Delta-like zinc finger family protein n=1 Tax=Cupriavidus sp. AcVe19-1a TaxID=2821359 RepID=UPI001AE77C5D|nr:ogr/Delta-like zinc finger family protein [Cupriavidus sp. AcVe19-1a]MBP0629766.1 ogr/Delta-like zinc finger family protein [Cupriavidus sp. AcVe19-1a]
MKLSCPHCETRMKIRTSRVVSLLSKESYWQCPNIACAYTCKAITSVVTTIAPSMVPNPKVYLPASRQRAACANDRQLDLLPTG